LASFGAKRTTGSSESCAPSVLSEKVWMRNTLELNVTESTFTAALPSLTSTTAVSRVPPPNPTAPMSYCIRRAYTLLCTPVPLSRTMWGDPEAFE